MKLPPRQREVLLVVVAQGLSYEEAAQVCGCAVGSVKSRLHRARRIWRNSWPSATRKTLVQIGSRGQSCEQPEPSTSPLRLIAGSVTTRRRGSWSSL
jgi:hypothetical protein